MKRSLLLIVLSLAILSCQKTKTPAASDLGAAMRIKTAPVLRMDMIDTVRIYGKIKLRQEALLASQFDGRLTDFSLLMGDRVRKGQRIGTVIPPQREALLQTLSALDPEMRPILEEQIKAIPLKSPIDGVVLDVMQHEGDVLQKGETIVHLGDLRQLDVHGDVPLRYLPLVAKLKSIAVSFVDYPAETLFLPVEAIGGKVDEARQTASIRLGLDNRNGEFRPGMQARLAFPGQTHKAALVIPRAALLEEEGVYSVFVVKGNAVEKRLVELGILNNDRVEVRSGLKEGERVAMQKAYSLTDGMEVVVE